MKKIASIAAIALFAVAFTSCKKDYTCECTGSVNGQPFSTQTIELKDQKKKDAEAACSSQGSTIGGGVTMTVDCNLK